MSTDGLGAPRDRALARSLPALVRKRLDQSAVAYLYGLAPFGLPGLVDRWVAERPARVLWSDLRCGHGEERSEGAALRAAEVALETGRDDHSVVVIEGAECLAGPVLDRLISRVAGRDGPRLVLIADRAPRGLPSAVTTVGPADARYSREDCAQSFASAGVLIAEEALDRVLVESDGWPQLVDMVVDACAPEGLDHDPHVEVHLASSQIRSRMDTWLPEHWTGVLRFFAPTGRLALAEIDALADRDATAIVREMLDLGAVRRETAERDTPCVALHPMLHRALREQLTARDRAEVVASLREAAILRDRLGVLDCGLLAALEAEDWSLCSAIIDRHVLELTFTSRWRDVQRAMLAMPIDALRENPYTALRAELLGLLPLGTTSVAIPSSAAEAQRVHRTGASLKILERTQAAITARRVFGRMAEAREMALRVAPMIDLCQRTPGTPATAYAPVWCLQAGLACYLAGDGEGARALFDRGWQLRQYDETGFMATDLASKLATYNAIHGDADQARRWLAEQGEGPKLSMPFHSWVYSGFRVAEITLATDALDLERAAQVSRLIDDEVVRNEMWPFLLWAQARLDLVLGRPHRVLERVTEARRVYGGTLSSGGLAEQICVAVTAQARLAQGQGTEAERLLATLPATTPIGLTTRVLLRLLTGRTEEARNMAADARARPRTPLRDRVELCLLEAAAEARLGDAEAAVELLGRGFSLLTPADHRLAFATIPEGMLAELSITVPDVAAAAEELKQRGVGAIYPESVDLVTLTEREAVVLGALASGRKLDAIAKSLHVSLNTVKSQVRVVYAKLGTHNRAEAVAAGRRLGLIDT